MAEKQPEQKRRVGDGTDSPKGAPDPGRALDLLAKLAEFAAPKLSRAEVTGKDGGDIQQNITVTFKRMSRSRTSCGACSSRVATSF